MMGECSIKEGLHPRLPLIFLRLPTLMVNQQAKIYWEVRDQSRLNKMKCISISKIMVQNEVFCVFQLLMHSISNHGFNVVSALLLCHNHNAMAQSPGHSVPRKQKSRNSSLQSLDSRIATLVHSLTHGPTHKTIP